MALQTKTITGNGARGHHKFTLTITENSKSDSANTSSIGYSFQIAPITSGYNWSDQGTNISYTITINGTNYTGTVPSYNGSSTVTLKSGTVTVAHNTDGTKTLSFSFKVTDRDGESYTCGNASASGSMTLTKTTGTSTSTGTTKTKTITATMNAYGNIYGWLNEGTAAQGNGSSYGGSTQTTGVLYFPGLAALKTADISKVTLTITSSASGTNSSKTAYFYASAHQGGIQTSLNANHKTGSSIGSITKTFYNNTNSDIDVTSFIKPKILLGNDTFCIYSNSATHYMKWTKVTMTVTYTEGGLVYIDNGSGWDAYQVYIDNGSSWDRYIPYIDNGTSWDQY